MGFNVGLCISVELPLPEGWKQTLPQEDHKWVAKSLFHFAPNGKVELDAAKATELWYSPPGQPLTTSQAPKPNRYFAHRLVLWMQQDHEDEDPLSTS